MPLTHTETYRVRSYECDLYNHLNHVNYLRLMQETGMRATEAAGFSMDQTQGIPAGWVARTTRVDFRKEVRFGDRLEIKTWIQDYRRVTCHRVYEFRLAGSEELAATAYTDWVYVDLETQRPTAIPEEVIGAFFPEGAIERGPRHPGVPEAEAPEDGGYCNPYTVVWRDLDINWHVNNAVYLDILRDCHAGALQYFGWGFEQFYQDHGLGWITASIMIDYLQPAYLHDKLELRSWITRLGNSSHTRHFTIVRPEDGATLVRADYVMVCVDMASGKTQPPPEAWVQAMAPNTKLV